MSISNVLTCRSGKEEEENRVKHITHRDGVVLFKVSSTGIAEAVKEWWYGFLQTN